MCRYQAGQNTEQSAGRTKKKQFKLQEASGCGARYAGGVLSPDRSEDSKQLVSASAVKIPELKQTLLVGRVTAVEATASEGADRQQKSRNSVP
jgi:hypothetical protein